MDEPIVGRITQFVECVGRYFTYYNAVGWNADILARQNEQRIRNFQTAERMADSHHKHCVHGAEAVKLGRALTVELEGAGFNTTNLLRFLHTIDGGGGAERAAPPWPDLKASLQRFTLRSAVGKGPTVEAATPIVTSTMSDEARALAVLTDHPIWTDGKIAEAAGVNRTSLYRFPRYVQARKLLAADGPKRRDRRKGRTGERLGDTLGDTQGDTSDDETLEK